MKISFLFLLLIFTGKTFCQSKEDSLLKLFIGIKSELARSQAQIVSLKNDNLSLSERLSEIDGQLPVIRRCNNSKTTEGDLYLSFDLSKLGRIKVSIYDGKNPNAIDSAIGIYDQFPKFHFIKLAPDKKYFIRAVVIDPTGKEKRGSVYDFKSDPENLIVTTKFNVQSPNLTLLSKPKIFSDKIEMTYKENNGQKIALGYICEKLVKLPDNSYVKEKIDSKDIDLDVNGNLSDANSSPTLKISKLEPNEEYFVTVKGINEFGKSTLLNYSIKTTEVNKELQFIGGIYINYNPIETVVAWKANKKPGNPTVIIKSADGQTKILQDAIYRNDSCVATLNYSQFQQIINTKEGNNKTVPVIVASMTDENNVVKSIEMKISYTLPNKEEISKAKGIENSVKESLSSAVSEVSEAVSNNKKIKWERLIQLGLPLVLGLF